MPKKHIDNPKREEKYNWFAGLTDGDGTFSFSLNNRKKLGWNCTFKIGASLTNARLLRYCQKIIGCGSVNLRAGKNGAEYRIRDRKMLRAVILPLFEKHSLYTTKAFYYSRWKGALDILDSNLPATEKHLALQLLHAQHPTANYIAAAWKREVPSRAWVSGFIEAEGSFFICNKGGSGGERLVHAFGCTQKLDRVVLDWVRSQFHIPARVLLRSPKSGVASYHRLETTNARALSRIRLYFKGQFCGRKGLEFRIWERTLKWRGQNERLRKVQKLLRDLRLIHGSEA